MPAAQGPIRVRVKKPKPGPSFTAPLGNAAAPILKAQRQAHANTQKAQRKILARTSVPAIPKLKHPSSRQRAAAVSMVAGSLHRQGITTPAQVKALPKTQRVRVSRAKGYSATQTKQSDVAGALARGVKPGSLSQTQLARIGRQIDAQTRAQILPGKPHKRVGIPGLATIDLTGAERVIGKHLAGNPISAVIKAVPEAAALTAKQKGVIGLSGRALQDAIDLPASTVTSLYYVGKQGATGHPLKAAKALGEPILHTIEHPVSSFSQHPLNTVLILRGVKSAGGHAIGKTLRVIPSETTRRVASTARAARTLPGTAVEVQRRYSGDPSTKATQVAVEKATSAVAKSKTGRKLGVSEPTRVRAGDLHANANMDVAAHKNIATANAGKVARKAKKALGRKPTAATNLAAQGVTNASRADLEAYLREVKAAEPKLIEGGDKELLGRNRETQKLIQRALKNHDPAKVQTAAEAYAKLVASELEPQAQALGIVNPREAEATRLVGPAVRLKGHSQEGYNAANKAAGEARVAAVRVKRSAKADVVKADQALERARANARVSVAARKKSPALAAAVKERDAAVRDLAGMRRAESKAKGRAEVLSRNVGGKAGGYGVQLAQSGLRDARERVRVADERVRVETARIRGVAPTEADALRRALAGREGAVSARQQASAAANEATALHRELGGRRPSKARKAAPFVDEHGNPVHTADVRAAMSEHGTISEPAFVSHQPIPPRTAALPTGRTRVKVKAQRTGEGVRQGTLDVHPMKLVEQAQHTQRLIDAAKAHEAMVDEYGYRGSEPQAMSFKRAGDAENFARDNKLQASTGHKFEAVQRQDGSYALIPKPYLDQLGKFEKATNAGVPGKAILSRWRRVVLAFSPRWLTGNSFEAAVRSMIAGAGPTSYVTAHRAMGALDPEALAEFKARALPGGNYGAADRLARERVTASDLGAMGRAAHELLNVKGVKQSAAALGKAYEGWTRLVFHAVNGNLEFQFQKAMVGKAIRQHPTLMNERIVGLSAKAAREAAEGLKDTPTMRELGRQVRRMYGQYDAFPPKVANAIANYTPFLAWTWNAANFLYHVLPADHPILTGVAASANNASIKWRKQHGLYMDFLGKTSGQLPPWLQGSIPGKAGSHLRLSRYTPFGLLENQGANPAGGVADLLLPQFSEIVKNLGGSDWKNTNLSKNPSGARAMIAALTSFIEAQVPLVSQGAAVAGLHTPNMADTTKVSGSAGTRAGEQFNPVRFTPASKKQGTGSTDPLLAKYGLTSGSNLDSLAKKYGVGSGTSVDDLAKKYGLGGK